MNGMLKPDAADVMQAIMEENARLRQELDIRRAIDLVAELEVLKRENRALHSELSIERNTRSSWKYMALLAAGFLAIMLWAHFWGGSPR